MSDGFRYCDLELHRQPCMLCGSAHFSVLATHDRHGFGLTTQGCRQCGLVQTNPRPSDSDLARFYVEHYRRFYQAIDTPDTAYVQSFKKDTRLRYTADHLWNALALDRSRVLLDCGCGRGSLFVALRERGSPAG